jgi:hypothetical protein
MSENNDWGSLWDNFNKSLENWKEIMESFQKASLQMQEQYNIVEKATQESSVDTMKQFGENWLKALTDTGFFSFKDFNEQWKKAVDSYDVKSFQEFGQNWQKMMTNDIGIQQMKAYGDMMKKFAETWNTMWPQK